MDSVSQSNAPVEPEPSGGGDDGKPTGFRQIPGLRSGSGIALAAFIVWTAVSGLGVLSGLLSVSIGVVVFYLVLYLAVMGIALLIATNREKSAPDRAARSQRQVEAKLAAQEEADRQQRDKQQAQSAVSRDPQVTNQVTREAKADESARKAEAKTAEKARKAEAKEAEKARKAEARAEREAKRVAAAAEMDRVAALTVTLTPDETRLVRAYRLRETLDTEGELPTLDPGGIVLQEGESLYVRQAANMYEFRGAEVEYSQGGALFFGSPLFLVGSLAVSAAASAANRSRARRQATAQWRVVDSGTLLLTNKTLSLMGGGAWHEIPLDTIRAAECEVDALAIHVANRAPLRIEIANPEQTYLMLQKVAWNRLPEAHLPPELANRLEAAEEVNFTAE